MTDPRERVAQAIYMTHWELPVESLRGLDHRFPPTWETASEAVRSWVRKQADSAIAAYPEPFDDPIPGHLGCPAYPNCSDDPSRCAMRGPVDYDDIPGHRG